MSHENIAKLLEQRGLLVEKLVDMVAYSEYHEGLNFAIAKIDQILGIVLTKEEAEL